MKVAHILGKTSTSEYLEAFSSYVRYLLPMDQRVLRVRTNMHTLDVDRFSVVKIEMET